MCVSVSVCRAYNQLVEILVNLAEAGNLYVVY